MLGIPQGSRIAVTGATGFIGRHMTRALDVAARWSLNPRMKLPFPVSCSMLGSSMSSSMPCTMTGAPPFLYPKQTSLV